MGIDGTGDGKVWAAGQEIVRVFVFSGWVAAHLPGISGFLFRFEMSFRIYKGTKREYILWITHESTFSGILWEICPFDILVHI